VEEQKETEIVVICEEEFLLYLHTESLLSEEPKYRKSFIQDELRRRINSKMEDCFMMKLELNCIDLIQFLN
jgi:hypothetical protein